MYFLEGNINSSSIAHQPTCSKLLLRCLHSIDTSFFILLFLLERQETRNGLHWLFGRDSELTDARLTWTFLRSGEGLNLNKKNRRKRNFSDIKWPKLKESRAGAFQSLFYFIPVCGYISLLRPRSAQLGAHYLRFHVKSRDEPLRGTCFKKGKSERKE